MDFFEVLNSRVSYRGLYKPTPVPREDLETIMKAGLSAPSGCNTQTTSIVAVDDPEMLKAINSVKKRPVGETAPAMIMVLTSRIPSYHGHCYSVQDYSAAIENMLLAITALGYSSCWVEGFVTDDKAVNKALFDILQLSEEYEVVCCLPLGIAAEEPKHASKKPFSERAWFNIKPPQNA